MIITITVGLIPPSILSIILSRFNFSNLNAVGAISEIIWIPIIAYSILRYRQMNVRAVFTEVLAIAMAAIFFINIFIDIPFGLWGRVITFVAFIILAFFLIKGVLREAAQREELNMLNKTLSERVAAQTVEIRKSFEAEKHARMELEKLNEAKDQFIMITQHHLRTPVTSILWALESVLKGAYGKIDKNLGGVLTDTMASGKRLMGIVNDFLNITAIKVGTNILKLEKRSLQPAIKDILSELKPDIENLGLYISCNESLSSWPELMIDYDKMRESLFIIIENAVKYNHKSGKIDIKTNMDTDAFVLTIENTGIGIDSEEGLRIGNSLFYRGIEARKNNPIGMGIGLSVVKAMVKAHRGTFAIESKGRDRGARVTVSLPLISKPA